MAIFTFLGTPINQPLLKSVTVTFTDDSTHTYYRLPQTVSKPEIINRVKKDFPDKEIKQNFVRGNLSQLAIEYNYDNPPQVNIPSTNQRTPIPQRDIQNNNLLGAIISSANTVRNSRGLSTGGLIRELVSTGEDVVVNRIQPDRRSAIRKRASSPINRRDVQPVTDVRPPIQDNTPPAKSIDKVFSTPAQAQSAVKQYEKATKQKAAFRERTYIDPNSKLPETVYETYDVNKKPVRLASAYENYIGIIQQDVTGAYRTRFDFRSR